MHRQLLPHLTVEKNLLFGYRRVPPPLRRIAFDEVVDLLGLACFLTRYPGDLSGGQRQRVAIGCALLTSPELLLMDEPMAALDEASKAEIMPYLVALKVRLKLPMLYVTHTTEEALRLGDHLVVLDQGQVVAQGPLPELISDGTIPGLTSEGLLNLLLVEPVPGPTPVPGLVPVTLAGQTLWLTQQQVAQYSLPPEERLRLQIPAKGLVLSLAITADPSVLNQLQTQVETLQEEPDGEFCRVRLRLVTIAALGVYISENLQKESPVLVALIPQAVAERLQLKPGLAVRLLISQIRLLG